MGWSLLIICKLFCMQGSKKRASVGTASQGRCSFTCQTCWTPCFFSLDAAYLYKRVDFLFTLGLIGLSLGLFNLWFLIPIFIILRLTWKWLIISQGVTRRNHSYDSTHRDVAHLILVSPFTNTVCVCVKPKILFSMTNWQWLCLGVGKNETLCCLSAHFLELWSKQRFFVL